MLRVPLSDPRLELRFWDSRAESWDGPLEPAPGCSVTVIERDDRPAAALIHDAQLNDDPELLHAAGAVAVVAAENAELDAGWHEALDELRRSRARITNAVDAERRRVALDLHDSVQQRLSVIHLRLASAAEHDTDPATSSSLQAIGDDVQGVIEEVRSVSQGLYPQLLADRGLVVALEHAIAPMPVRQDDVGRYAPKIEAAVYYSCLEAVQNAAKHAGAGASVSVTLHGETGTLVFEVADDGSGFDPSTASDGLGLQSMRDRVGAVGGGLSITSRPGRGTVVSGWVPIESRSGFQKRPQIGAGQEILDDETARPAGLREIDS